MSQTTVLSPGIAPRQTIMNTQHTNNDVSNTETETSATGAFPNERNTSGYDGSAETTNFTAEADTVSATQQQHIVLLKDLDTGIQTETGSTDIIAFLKIPYIIQSGVFNSNDTITQFTTIECPRDIFSGNTTWLNKLQGVYGLKFTMVFTIVINATRFQQGRYMLCWTPTCGHTGTNDNSARYYTMHNATISQVVQTPHVEFDLNCDTTATLRIPFASTMSHYPMMSTYSATGTRYGELGFVRIVPYEKLNAIAGQQDASFTLWVHLEDVELGGRWYAQMGKSKALDSTSDEQEDGNIGPIGRTFGQISKVANIVSQAPFLSTYAKPVAWAADLAAKASYVFGWSRPANLEPIMRMQNNSLAYWKTGDMPDNSLPISLFARNQVEVLPGFAGTDRDEMSIDYIKSIMSYIGTYDWLSTSVAGTQLMVLDMNPSFLRYGTVSMSGFALMNHSTISWLATHFQYYRGGFIIKIKFVKTEFHSGRIMVIWQPGDDNYVAPLQPTLAQSMLVHREILDIRYSNEVTLTIPYISTTHYKNCGPTGSMGTLQLRVLDQLRAPATVPSTVRMIVEVCGAPDLEFAFPCANRDYMVMPLTPQSADTSANPCSTENVVIGRALSHPRNDIFARVCIGEHVSSLRTLLKKSDAICLASADPVRNWAPYMTSVGDIVTADPGPFELRPPRSWDFYDKLQCIYAMSRGGVRCKAYNAVSRATVPVSASLFNFEFTHEVPDAAVVATTVTWNGFTPAEDPVYNSCRLQVINDQTTNFATEVQVPQYHFLQSRNSCAHIGRSGVAHLFYQSLATRVGLSMVFHANSTNVVTARSGSDDCQFSYFVSIPPVREVSTIEPPA